MNNRQFNVFLLASCLLITTGAWSAVPMQPSAIPAQGQSSGQLAADESACYQQAANATGFYPGNAPSVSAPATSSSRGASAVRRAAGGAALGAVVGALAGDAGKGAAIGATAGGVSGLTQNNAGVGGGALSGAAVGAAAGAVGGDAGKGAAIGAVAGAIGGGIKKQRQNAAQQQADAAYEQQLSNYYNVFAGCMSQRGYTIGYPMR